MCQFSAIVRYIREDGMGCHEGEYKKNTETSSFFGIEETPGRPGE